MEGKGSTSGSPNEAEEQESNRWWLVGFYIEDVRNFQKIWMRT
jgi:hypothetical protein